LAKKREQGNEKREKLNIITIKGFYGLLNQINEK
jgi:hypothetical protein